MNEERFALKPVPNAVGNPRTNALVAVFGALAQQGRERGPRPYRVSRAEANPFRSRPRYSPGKNWGSA